MSKYRVKCDISFELKLDADNFLDNIENIKNLTFLGVGTETIDIIRECKFHQTSYDDVSPISYENIDFTGAIISHDVSTLTKTSYRIETDIMFSLPQDAIDFINYIENIKSKAYEGTGSEQETVIRNCSYHNCYHDENPPSRCKDYTKIDFDGSVIIHTV